MTVNVAEVRKNIKNVSPKFVSGEVVGSNTPPYEEKELNEQQGDTIQPPVRPISSGNG